MAKDGVFWFGSKDPTYMAKRFSAASAKLGIQTGGIVSSVVDEAAEAARHVVMTSGVKDRKPTGGPRIYTGTRPGIEPGAMYNSLGAKMITNARGRSQGAWGFIDNAPFYTIFQEEGTKSGIIPMHALVTGYEVARRRLAAEISSISIWGGLR